ncbi:MAG TPA: DNA repair and recombination protein RadA, partial [Nitrososphaera sp.]|nr:DNA repair and recombination protein RadA [Nitrososphaera sp.]
GGNIVGHASTYRIYLRKAGNDRIAKMIDSPYHPYSDIRFTVNEKGIDDTEEKEPKSKKKAAADDDD